MKVKVIGTGSKGNCYLVEDETGNILMLECGISYKDLILSPQWCGADKIDGLLVTHSHKDHSLELEQFRKLLGDDKIVYGHDGDVKSRYDFGNWIINVHRVPHHNIPCVGFVIYNIPEDQAFAFFTDTTAPRLICDPRVQNWLYEVNYDTETAELALSKEFDELDYESLSPEQKEKVDKLAAKDTHVWFNLRSHNSLENAVEYFKKVTEYNKGDKTEQIIVIHASKQYFNAEKVLATLNNYADNVYIADNGMEYEI